MTRRLPSLIDLHDDMFATLGPQGWWPGELPLEVVIGAVLVQNAAWRNVERAIAPPASYEKMQTLFERRLPADPQLYNEYHALSVGVGHHFCRSRPKCDACPLRHCLPRSGPIES